MMTKYIISQKSYRYDNERVIVTVTISPINKINKIIIIYLINYYNNKNKNNKSIVIVTVTLTCVLSLRYLFPLLGNE